MKRERSIRHDFLCLGKRERKEGNVEQVGELECYRFELRSMSSYLNEPRLSSAAAHSLSRRANKRPAGCGVDIHVWQRGISRIAALRRDPKTEHVDSGQNVLKSCQISQDLSLWSRGPPRGSKSMLLCLETYLKRK